MGSGGDARVPRVLRSPVFAAAGDEDAGAGDAKPDAAASAAAVSAPDAGAAVAVVAGGAASSAPAAAAVPVLGSVLLGGDGAEISYEDMLAAIFGLLHANNPDLTERWVQRPRRRRRALHPPPPVALPCMQDTQEAEASAGHARGNDAHGVGELQGDVRYAEA